jgi:hypothetical protein
MKTSIEEQLDLLNQGIANIPELKKVLLICLQRIGSAMLMKDLFPPEKIGTDNTITRLANYFSYKGYLSISIWEFTQKISIEELKNDPRNNIGPKCIKKLQELLKEKGYEWK